MDLVKYIDPKTKQRIWVFDIDHKRVYYYKNSGREAPEYMSRNRFDREFRCDDTWVNLQKIRKGHGI